MRLGIEIGGNEASGRGRAFGRVREGPRAPAGRPEGRRSGDSVVDRGDGEGARGLAGGARIRGGGDRLRRAGGEPAGCGADVSPDFWLGRVSAVGLGAVDSGRGEGRHRQRRGHGGAGRGPVRGRNGAFAGAVRDDRQRHRRRAGGGWVDLPGLGPRRGRDRASEELAECLRERSGAADGRVDGVGLGPGEERPGRLRDRARSSRSRRRTWCEGPEKGTRGPWLC